MPSQAWQQEHRERILISPRRLGHITRQIRVTQHWEGTSRGFKMTIDLGNQPTLDGERMTWRIRIRGTWQQGKAGTVFDCVRAMEREAAK